MKNKAMTYLLIAAVAVVWGLVIFRIFSAVGGDDNDATVNPATTIKEAYNDYTIPKDTTHLLLNYRDPFGQVKKDTAEISIKKLTRSPLPIQTKAVAATPQINWSAITYNGYIRNADTKKLIAVLTFNGKNMTLAEGESANSIRLLKNLRDSIKISYQGKTHFIILKP